MTTRHDGGSSVAWTVGHVTTMLDSWINTNFQGLPAHPLISNRNFRTGGTGEENDWTGVLAAVEEVRGSTRRFLDPEPGPELERVVPYNGSIEFLHPMGLRLSYALMRIAVHLLHPRRRDTDRPRPPGPQHRQDVRPRLGPSPRLKPEKAWN